MKHLDVIKILSFGLALSTVTEAGAMSASSQYETYNSLPPTLEHEVYNTLPPTPNYLSSQRVNVYALYAQESQNVHY